MIPNIQSNSSTLLHKAPGINNNDHSVSGAGIGTRHMVIKYNTADKKYYLRDLGDGSGTFIRVDN